MSNKEILAQNNTSFRNNLLSAIKGLPSKGVTGIDYGEVELSASSSSITVEHTLGVVPTWYAIMPKNIASTGWRFIVIGDYTTRSQTTAIATTVTKTNDAITFTNSTSVFLAGTYIWFAIAPIPDDTSGTGDFSFTIEGTTYYADTGMTWADWCASDYNTAGFIVSSSDNYVHRDNNSSSASVVMDAETEFVLKTQTIVSGADYYYS